MSENAIQTDPAASPDQFNQQMQHFSAWKDELSQIISNYQLWLKNYDKGTPETELRLYDALQSLKDDRLNIAFVAEFSRGKTELINAIFFANYGQRLLPSEAGRTTMCPTELLFDHALNQSYIKMLPIESRLSDMSLSDLKNEAGQWTMMPLDIDAPDKMVETFKEVIKTKTVNREEAERLGLYDEEMQQAMKNDEDAVEIPVWRHAIISFPHPLLKQGLVILDTPGLNALGSEPELTLNMLPSAQAVLFVLSADTGVTRSDLDIWQNHIMAFRDVNQSGLIAVLNKIDTLWDEMKKDDEVAASIKEQCKTSATMLDINAANVFPISAQKALIGKIKNNPALLKQSNLPALETLLANEIMPAKQQMIWDNIATSLDQMIANSHTPILSHMADIKTQLLALKQLHSSSEDTLQKMIAKAKAHKVAYYESVKNFQASRRKIALQAKNIFDILSEEAIDTLILKTRQEMKDSWTTGGLKKGMSGFFDHARDAMQIASRQIDQTHKIVESIYSKFQEEHSLHLAVPPSFPINDYNIKLQNIYNKAENYRTSTMTTITEQSFVIKNFFISLVSHIRALFVQTHHDVDLWFKDLVNPLVAEIQEKRDSIEQHMDTLNKVSGSKTELDGKLKTMQEQYLALKSRGDELQTMRDKLETALPPNANS